MVRLRACVRYRGAHHYDYNSVDLKECDASVYHTIESDLPSASTSSILQGSSEWVHVVH